MISFYCRVTLIDEESNSLTTASPKRGQRQNRLRDLILVHTKALNQTEQILFAEILSHVLSLSGTLTTYLL